MRYSLVTLPLVLALSVALVQGQTQPPVGRQPAAAGSGNRTGGAVSRVLPSPPGPGSRIPEAIPDVPPGVGGGASTATGVPRGTEGMYGGGIGVPAGGVGGVGGAGAAGQAGFGGPHGISGSAGGQASFGGGSSLGSIDPTTAGMLGGYGGGYDFGTATTPFGAGARGLGELVRAQGAYNLLSSAAAVNLTEAQRRMIENTDAAVRTYFELRRVNEAYRAAERPSRPTYEDVIRYAAAGRPERLSPSALDTVTGQITWPMILRSDKFKEYRDVLGQLFVSRAATGTLSSEGYLTIDQVTGAMMAELQRYVDQLPPQDYLAARKFIESLAYEAKVPTG